MPCSTWWIRRDMRTQADTDETLWTGRVARCTLMALGSRKEVPPQGKSVGVHAPVVLAIGFGNSCVNTICAFGGLLGLGEHASAHHSYTGGREGRHRFVHGLRQQLATRSGAGLQPAGRHRPAGQWQNRRGEDQPGGVSVSALVSEKALRRLAGTYRWRDSRFTQPWVAQTCTFCRRRLRCSHQKSRRPRKARSLRSL